MKKSFSLRWVSLLLAVMMVFSILPLSVFAVDTSTDDTRYTDFLSSLTTLEGYADAYAREHSGEDATALVINYIRCGVEKYTSSTWTTFCKKKCRALNGAPAREAASRCCRRWPTALCCWNMPPVISGMVWGCATSSTG